MLLVCDATARHLKCTGRAIHLIKTHLKGDVFEEGRQLEMKRGEVQDLHFPV